MRVGIKIVISLTCLIFAIFSWSLYSYAADPDLNDDGIVNVLDISIVSSRIGLTPSDPNYDAIADVDSDGDIDYDDLNYVASHFGETYPVVYRVIEFPSVNPDGIFVNEPTLVTITVQLGADPELILTEIYLLRVDEQGNVIANLGRLYDDGTHGDRLPGDGIFTTQYEFNEDNPGEIYLKVSANYTSEPAIGYSEVFKIDVVEHISDEDYTEAINMPKIAEQHYKDLVAQYGEEEARNRLVEWLEQQPTIAKAGISENGYGIWWVFESGILGGLILSPEGLKGSIGSTKAIDLSPFYNGFNGFNGFYPEDDYDGAFTELKKSQCPKFTTTAFLNDTASVERFKNLSNYGVIIISSHGDSWYNGLLSWWQDHFGEEIDFFENWLSQVVILTRTIATKDNKKIYEIDLSKHRLVIANNSFFCITPAFIVHYNRNFPYSLVYVSACRSLYNSSMADAFLSKGAKVYFGYTDYVPVNYAFNCGKSLFEHLVEGETAKEAFEHAIQENGEHAGTAYFKMKGDGDLTISVKNLVENGNFEKGNLSGWTTGFTRGGDFPEYAGPGGYWTVISERKVEGDYAARLGRFDQTYTQGLYGPPQPGDEPAGIDWMYQDIEIPERLQTTLKFYYKVRTYDTTAWDWFIMQIRDPETNAVLATVIDKAGKPGYDYGEYWESDWKEVNYDLSAFAGRKIRLWFGCRQDGYGDQTAVYIDNIHINCD